MFCRPGTLLIKAHQFTEQELRDQAAEYSTQSSLPWFKIKSFVQDVRCVLSMEKSNGSLAFKLNLNYSLLFPHFEGIKG
jgi:hypothetical protein